MHLLLSGAERGTNGAPVSACPKGHVSLAEEKAIRPAHAVLRLAVYASRSTKESLGMRVLLVEDDEMIGHSLREALQGQGWSVDWVKDGLLAQSAWDDGDYACVLLDLGLPKRDGVEVLRQARSRGDTTPVLVLTARDGVDDRVSGLDLGADDYLLKPYEMRELLARMRAVIRRRDGAAHSVIGNAAVQLDITTREVMVQGERSQLSAREFALLHALLERPGAILSREQLENRIYGWGEEVSSNAVDVLIHGMRRKLGPDAIRNVRGLGWRVTGAAGTAGSAGAAA